MNYDKYTDISSSEDAEEFQFISEGPKGELNKIVKFSTTDIPKIYNLALGTILPDLTVDWSTLSNNGDRNKVLATTVAIAYIFSDTFPDRQIFLRGDVPAKTKLYQIAIATEKDEIGKNFDIYGLKNNEFIKAIFNAGINYDGFLFVKK